MMERRRSQRVSLSLFAELTLAENNFNGFIENLSETGIFKRVFTNKEVEGFLPGADVAVNFMLPSEEIVDLKCNVKWLRLNSQPFSEIIYEMGLELINPPRKYLEFVKSLYDNC
jgi:hypothetical protein